MVGVVFNGIKLKCKYLVHLKLFPSKSTYVKTPQILIHFEYTVLFTKRKILFYSGIQNQGHYRDTKYG